MNTKVKHWDVCMGAAALLSATLVFAPMAALAEEAQADAAGQSAAAAAAVEEAAPADQQAVIPDDLASAPAPTANQSADGEGATPAADAAVDAAADHDVVVDDVTPVADAAAATADVAEKNVASFGATSSRGVKAATVAAAPAMAGAKAPVSVGWSRTASGAWVYGDASTVANGSATLHKGWLVTDVRPGETESTGLQRYWLDPETGVLAQGSLVDAGNDYWAYAKSDGTIVRGRWTDPTTGYVYLANNDGKTEQVGWNVSNAYGQGLQRYYVDEALHACLPGFSDQGWGHYTMSDGYVLRGAYIDETGARRYANNDGVLSTGWVVTGAFTNGALQRYYAEADGSFRSGFFNEKLAPSDQVASHFYADATTMAVLRGRLQTSFGYLLADNDGRLAELPKDGVARTAGQMVSGEYDGGRLQRYALVEHDGHLYAAVGHVEQNGVHYFGLSNGGYVLRGAHELEDGRILLASNDGVLSTAKGWFVSKDYGSGLQRYYLYGAPEGYSYAKAGYSEDGWAHYTVSGAGYVMRNASPRIDKYFYQADNDGRVARWLIKDSVIKYCDWTLAIAADDSHGYSQYTRSFYPYSNGDYDCSSLVISALRVAGFNTGTATYTGNMRSNMLGRGWSIVGTTNIDFKDLRYGDILLNDVTHVAIYVGDGNLVQAGSSETGGIHGRAGDQTGHEIDVRPVSRRWWNVVLRVDD